MNITRNQRRVAAAESRQRSAVLTEYDQSQWPKDGDRRRQRVLVSRDFLAQVFVEDGVLRLTVSRTKMRPDGRWEDGITWDELMQVKREAGYGNLNHNFSDERRGLWQETQQFRAFHNI